LVAVAVTVAEPAWLDLMVTLHDPVESVVQPVAERVPSVDENEKTIPWAVGLVVTVMVEVDIESAGTACGLAEMAKSWTAKPTSAYLPMDPLVPVALRV
jgi:hypothetical protein